MAATTDHPCFRQPTGGNIKLWRYMDFTKFTSLISSSELFFCRADLLGDPLEGSYSKANIELRPVVYKKMKEGPKPSFDEMFNQMSKLSMWIRQWTYINCWHANDYESAAMWKMYSKSDEAIAIVTTYGQLVNVLSKDIYVGSVNYIDYEKDWLPEGNSFYPFMHKRKSFEYENEVRALIQETPIKDGVIATNSANGARGEKIKIDTNALINEIYLAPTSTKWYRDLVEEIIKKYDMVKPIINSALDSKPVF